jgi:hypothetical protein
VPGIQPVKPDNQLKIPNAALLTFSLQRRTGKTFLSPRHTIARNEVDLEVAAAAGRGARWWRRRRNLL